VAPIQAQCRQRSRAEAGSGREGGACALLVPRPAIFSTLQVRKWVLSVPKRLRYFLQREGDALSAAHAPWG